MFALLSAGGVSCRVKLLPWEAVLTVAFWLLGCLGIQAAPEGERMAVPVNASKPLGPPAPTGAAALKAPGQADAEGKEKAFYLENGNTGMAVWKTTGCLAGGWDLSTGRRVMQYSGDIYRFLPQKGDEKVAFEADDKVVQSKVLEGGKTIQFECENAGFPVPTRVFKTYSVHPTSGVIAKRMEFRAEKDWNGLVYWESVVNLESEFRRGGRFNNPDYHPADDAFFEADEVLTETKHPYRQQVVFYNPKQERTVGHHRILIDDKPAGQQIVIPEHYYSRDNVHFTPQGWRFFALADRLWTGKNPSATVHFAILPGDMIDYHRLMQSLPEFQEGNAITSRPDWVNEIKGYGPNLQNPVQTPEMLREWNALLQEGYGMIGMMGLFDYYDYPVTGEWTVSRGFSGFQKNEAPKVSAEQLKKELKGYRENAPRLKIYPYTSYWAVTPESRVFQEHPDWFLYKRNGDLDIDEAGLISRLMLPEHAEWLNERTRAIMKEFEFDAFYLDGGSFGHIQVDWPTMRVVQPVDGFTSQAKALGVSPDRPGLVNAGNGLYGWGNAIGFYEGFIRVTDWRALSIKLMELKLYQQPNTWFIPIHWSDADAMRYSSYCLELGFKGSVSITRKYLPLVNMSYELHPMLIQDVGLRPRWYAAEKGELEAYALGFDRKQLLISMWNHEKEAKKHEVSFDPAKTEMKADRETYVYHLRPEPPSVFLYNRLSEPEDQKVYQETGWAPIALAERSVTKVYANPQEASRQEISLRGNFPEHMAVTQVPGMIWSTNWHRKYFPLPQTRWGKVEGERDGDALNLTADCSQESEVAAIVPEDWLSVRVTLNGKPAGYRRGIPDLVITSVPKGRHELVVNREKGFAGYSVIGSRIEAPKQIAAGEPLEVVVKLAAPAPEATKAFLNVSRDAMPIFTSEPVEVAKGAKEIRWKLEAPESLPIAEYVLRVEVDGAEGTLEKPLTVKAPAMKYPEGWNSAANRKLEVKDINQEFFGYRVLRSFQETTGMGFAGKAKVDPSQFTMEVLSGLGYVAGEVGGALEFASIRNLNANVSMVLPPVRESFDTEKYAVMTFTMDFHTPGGYAKRVYFNASKPSEKMTASNGPAWGTNSSEAAPQVETQHFNWRSAYMTGVYSQWDLLEYAPKEWDGRVIFGIFMSAIAPDSRLFFRLKPQKAYSSNEKFFVDPSQLGERTQWKTGAYRLISPIHSKNSTASFEKESLTLKAKSGGAEGSAAARLLTEEAFVITVKAVGAGMSGLVADYVSPEGIAKRGIFVVSGDPKEVENNVKTLFPDFQGPVEVVDFRKEFDNGKTAIKVPFGSYAPQGWDAHWGRKLLLAAVAFGAGSEINIRLTDMDHFLRY